MVLMDSCRAVLTALVALSVLGLGDSLPAPDELDTVVGTRTGLFAIVVVASLLLGFAEVLRDNAAQTILPAIVEPQHLERANGRMWSAEQVANTFVGPPLGSVLLAAAFFLPFMLDAASFAVAAALVALMTGEFRARAVRPDGAGAAGSAEGDVAPGAGWRAELAYGFRWLWHNPLLRPMAIILGLANAVNAMQLATLILFAQEVLHTSPFQFALLTMGGALGAIAGGYTAPWIRDRLGSGPALWTTLAANAVFPLVIGLTSSWPLVMVAFGLEAMVVIVWNVITVSLRQTIIPSHLLGRVNSVYRFFGWGMMPVGTALGGVLVAVSEPLWGRETALRVPWFAAAAIGAATLVYAVPRLTTKKMEAARAAAIAARLASPTPSAEPSIGDAAR